MSNPKFKIGDRVRFSTDANRKGVIDNIELICGKYLYNVENDSGYVHLRVLESAIEMLQDEPMRASDASVVKCVDGKYNIEGLSERELLHICDCLCTNEVESDDHEFGTLADYIDDYCICFKLKKL